MFSYGVPPPPGTEINPHQPKARQTMGEHQRLICHTLDWWRPIPTHTNTPITGSAATPVPTPNEKKNKKKTAHWQEDQNEETTSLTMNK